MVPEREILLVEDHAIVREGLRALLVTDPKIKVVGEAHDGWSVIKKVNIQVDNRGVYTRQDKSPI